MSAQEDEIVLVNVESDPADTSEEMKDSEDENIAPQSSQSTWKGCVSDDEADVAPPSTPRRKVNVVIYTPTRTGMLVDDKVGEQISAQPSPPTEVPITAADNDNASLFSMSHYGSMDWDHTGDELNEIEVTPKITRRASSISLNNQTIFHELEPVTPSNKRGPTASASMYDTKARSLPRDSRGRFASKDPSSTSSRSSSVKKSSARRMSTSSDSTTSSLVRDVHGRFATKDDTPANRRVSTGEKAPRTLYGDEHGKFAPKSGNSATTPAKRRASVGSFAVEAVPFERNSEGKFTPKEATPIPVPKPLAKRKYSTSGIPGKILNILDDEYDQRTPKEISIPPPKRLRSARVLNDPSPEAAMNDDDSPKAKPTSKPPKAKRAATKSPYFGPPTTHISPELAEKSKGQKGNLAHPVEPPTTPRRDNGDTVSSPGSGKKRTPGKIVSCIPFPPLSSPYFGLIQEKLAHDPFRLLIAVTFLIRTHGKHAIPVFFELMEKYPTPESLVAADKEEIVPIIRHLGLQNQRAGTYQMYAKIWLKDPPTKGKRYPVRGYPNPESACDVKKGEILGDDDERHAWEIGHMTQGPYAIDSWRIFCRDRLRGEADGWDGEGRGEGFQPEWMRVLPEDKELRVYLRWMWLKEGFEWDPLTGDKDAARPELMRAAMEGRIAWDDQGGMRILDEPMSASPLKSDSDTEKSQVFTPCMRDSVDSGDELA